MVTPKKNKKSTKKGKPHAKPVSLSPLTFDEALAGLLETKPPPKSKKKSRKRKSEPPSS